MQESHGSPIPDFDANGNLPPGVYPVTLRQIEERFARNPSRKQLFEGLVRAVRNLAAAGVRRVWINGSFITSKPNPNDVDGCWEYPFASPFHVEKLDSVFVDISAPREAMRKKYGVDFLIAGIPLADPSAEGTTVEVFFQTDRDGKAKGILLVELGELDYDTQ
jgi:hypothetical protein